MASDNLEWLTCTGLRGLTARRTWRANCQAVRLHGDAALAGAGGRLSRCCWGPLGGRLYHSNFRTKVRWPALVGELGWPGLRFHDLRATAIVLWIRAEVSLTTVRALAGHASLATTDRYARIARNDLAGAAAQVDSYISRTRNGPTEPVEDYENGAN